MESIVTDDIDPLLQRIRGEFVEMPGLTLDERQAARLWHLERPLTAALLGRLVESRFLARSGVGVYRRLGAV